MPRHSYREYDYTFGQAMLRLRKRLRLTQSDLAERLGVSRRAVGEWEAGSNYPREHHLQHLIELCVLLHIFTPGREEEEIRALWKTAHQRLFLDEAWLAALLTRPPTEPAPVTASPRVDWVGALDVSHAEWRVCASARGASGKGASAQGESRWQHAGQLRR